MLGAIDVHIDLNGETTLAHTVSSLGDGVWQANLLLDEALPREATVRVRLGSGEWSAAVRSSGVGLWPAP